MLTSPYAGLLPFTEEQAPYFFGRDAERDIIIANLLAARLTLLYGPSGVGKSSVLNAGVAYHLRERSRASLRRGGSARDAIVLFRAWRDQPLAALERAVADETGATPEGASFAERLSSVVAATNRALLIVLDQFEEYFLYHGTAPAEPFRAELPRAVMSADQRVSFLVSMREDSIAKLDSFKGQIPGLFDNYLRIDHLDHAQAEEAIVRPIERLNQDTADPARRMSVEPGLVHEVLDQVTPERLGGADLGRGRISTPDGDRRRVQTPYLQLVMTRLWREETAQGSRVLRVDTLHRLGGADRIVATHLDSALSTLAVEERENAAKIFQFLVTPSRTKIALGVDDLEGYTSIPADVLQTLLLKLSTGESRVLSTVAPAPDQPAVERYQIFHDVLASAILDWRNAYVREAKAKAAAAEAEAERRRAEAERQRAEREATTAARLRLLLGLVVALFVATVGAFAYAWWQSQQFESARQALNAQVNEAQRSAAAQLEAAAGLVAEAQRSRDSALEQDKRALQLRADASEAERLGRAAQAQVLMAEAKAADDKSAAGKANAAQLESKAQQIRAGAENTLKKAGTLLENTSSFGAPANAAPVTPADAKPPEPAPATEPPPPATEPSTPAPAAPDPKPATPEPAPATPGEAGGTTKPAGDYRAVYRQAIEAKNRRQWKQAATLFGQAIALKPTDSGERVNISGAGNNEPYVPQFYLGLALKNLGDCAGALKAWDASERDNAIRNTSLYKTLQQNRAECQASRP